MSCRQLQDPETFRCNQQNCVKQQLGLICLSHVNAFAGELTMSTTVWLGMNSNTPSLAITRKDVVGVSWRTTISGSANTPMDSAAAASHDECGCLATSDNHRLQQHHVANSKHDGTFMAAHARHARCLHQGEVACEPQTSPCSVCLM